MKSHLSPAVATRLASRKRRTGAGALTAREAEVLDLVAPETSNEEIAKEPWIRETTVKGHLFRAFDKLGTKDRTSAATEALRRGVIRLEP